MIIKDELKDLSLKINMTLYEINDLATWMVSNENISSSTKINIINNGVDMHDLYATEILFDTESQKKILIDFIHGLSQEANFGGIRKNEYFI